MRKIRWYGQDNIRWAIKHDLSNITSYIIIFISYPILLCEIKITSASQMALTSQMYSFTKHSNFRALHSARRFSFTFHIWYIWQLASFDRLSCVLSNLLWNVTLPCLGNFDLVTSRMQIYTSHSRGHFLS